MFFRRIAAFLRTGSPHVCGVRTWTNRNGETVISMCECAPRRKPYVQGSPVPPYTEDKLESAKWAPFRPVPT